MEHKKQKKPKFVKRKISTVEVIKGLQERYDKIDVSCKKFSDLPLSIETLRGLKQHNFRIMTDIQRQCIGMALQGTDILGAAKTGNGKTLAFLIPVIQKLAGFDIEEAKKMLKEEDHFDKQMYKQKIKERQREEKRKRKEKQNAAMEENKESGEDNDVGPDSSWLPDPDKIYGKEKSDGNVSENDEQSNETENDDEQSDEIDSNESDVESDGESEYKSELDSDEEQIHRPFKRKLVTQGAHKKTKRKRSLSETVLQADEELALQLLGH